jgi:DNA-binding Lrp family transcriptional regulator
VYRLKKTENYVQYKGVLNETDAKNFIMDSTDQNLISALRENARTSLSGLAHRLGVSRTTVRSRIERLQQRGDVLGFTVVLKDDPVRDPVRGVMMIGIEGRGADRIVRQLTGLPELRAVHSTNGRWDVIAEIGTKSLEDFDHTLAKIRRIEGITSSETSLLLATRKAR